MAACARAPRLRVHLRSRCNYLSSLLAAYPPPETHAPFLVNAWRSTQEASPFRIVYATRNPAMHGLVITSDRVIPNFSWTPRLAIDAEALSAVAEQAAPPDLLVLPAVAASVVRLFYDAGSWYLATSHVLEVVPGPCRKGDPGPWVSEFERCLRAHYQRGLWRFAADLQMDRVWFFALYLDMGNMVHLGTCMPLRHSALPVDPRQEVPDLDFSLHRVLPPCIPILPRLAEVKPPIPTSTLVDPDCLSYAGLYDGILMLNPVTMFAVRLCTPEIVYLSPLLKRRLSVPEFLALQVVQAQLTDASRVHVDRVSHRWWKEDLRAFTYGIFAETCATLLSDIEWHVDTFPQWVGGWMSHISSLCWDEWNALDIDLQRLYVLLDYVYEEDGGTSWHRVLHNPKYASWVAKAVVGALPDVDATL